MRSTRPVFSAACLAAVCLGAASCERKAPGPAECVDFAQRVNGVRDEAALEVPRVRRRVDELTRSCLVTPFDRDLLRCVEHGAPALVCMRDFTARAARRERS